MENNIRVMISEEELNKRIREMAAQITEDYKGQAITLVCVLKGSIFFTCELAKRIELPILIDFLSVSSYGDATKSSGMINIKKDLDDNIEGKNVLIVEDIIDSGRTLSCLVNVFSERNPASITIATLLDKPDRREVEVDVRYTGFTIPDEFVVGYGLDFAQKYRDLPFIGVVEDEK